ncbi:hypothetical protein Gotur_025789 [Gossypium turneri]
MDQRLEKLKQLKKEMQDQLQAQMQERLHMIQQEMTDRILESQDSMMAKLTQLLTEGSDKGKGPMTNPSESNNEPLYPPGHSIENYTAFKKLVERFISMGIVKLDDSSSTENLLPNHAVNEINMMSEATGKRIKADVAKIKTLMRRVWKEMIKRGLIVSDLGERGEETRNYCEFHHKEGHEIQECKEFKVLVQGMMDDKEVEFYEEVKEEGSICASESTMRGSKVNHPVVIISRPKNNDTGVLLVPKIPIWKPAAFSYKDSKKVL